MRDHTTPARWTKALPDLLHDARLTTLAWDASSPRLEMSLNCLRRHVSGRAMRDTSVLMTLPSVCAFAIAWDSPRIETPPSTFRRRRRIRGHDLVQWRYAEIGVEVSTGRGDAVLEAITAGVVDWLHGDERAVSDAPFVVCFQMQSPRELGPPVDCVRILVASDAPVVMAGGRSLSLTRWRAELAAWWKGWRRYWGAARLRGARKPTPVRSSTSEPRWAVARHRLPRALAAPARAWFDDRVWMRAFGGPAHARAIVGHWIEGRRACVVVGGFARLPADEELPAEDRACTWALALRRRSARDAWRVTTWAELPES